MNLRIIAFFLLVSFFSSCHGPSSVEDRAGIDKEAAANRIIRKVALDLKQKTNLCPMGTMGQMLYDVEKLGLAFSCNKSIDIATGRTLLVQAVNTILEEINQDKRIHPYLCRHPFLPRNIEIQIFLRNPDGRDVPQGNLCVIDAQDGFLRYDIRHPTTNRLVTIYKESFDEALDRIADPTLPLAQFTPAAELSPVELTRIRKGISLVSDDGSIWHLNENGSWTKNPLP